jgi:hypothetical protein
VIEAATSRSAPAWTFSSPETPSLYACAAADDVVSYRPYRSRADEGPTAFFESMSIL